MFILYAVVIGLGLGLARRAAGSAESAELQFRWSRV